jgi:hypothetical protein
VPVRQFALLFIVFSAVLSACGPTCQSTCQKLYSESECNLQRPGKNQSELKNTCEDYCESALNEPGGLNGYDPFGREGSTNSVELETENQAASWMHCVDQSSCERLDFRSGEGGYCQPIW